MGLRMHRQVGALRKVLSQQAIGVLVRAALPGTLRIAETDVDFGRQRKATMIGKFLGYVLRLLDERRASVTSQGIRSRVSFRRSTLCLVNHPAADFQPTTVS